MTTFYLVAAAIAVVALLVLLRPWWLSRFTVTQRNSEAEAMRELNTAIYRDQIGELERDRDAGQLAEADYVESREELQRRLLADTRASGDATAIKGARGLWIVLALALPIAAAALYSVIGSPAAVLNAEEQDARAAASMDKMVGDLARRLEAQPDNPQGWSMLARSYAAMGRLDDAEKAFARIGPALEQDAGLLATYADFLVRKADGDFAGRPRELIAKALKLEPENMVGLYLAGADAMQNERWRDAIKHWEPLLKQLEPGSEDANNIGAALDHARQKSGVTNGNPLLGTGGTASSDKRAAAKAISGRVELSPALRAKAKPDDVLFVFARAEGGPPMPLAALRLTVAELPYNFSLSDANALGSAKLSDASAIRIEAKIAKGGTAGPAPGDLTGRSSVVKPGAKNVKVVIDTEIK